MRNADLTLDPVECCRCTESGFTPGGEFFDPLVLPHLAQLAAYPQIAWRVHLHTTGTDATGYFVEMLFAIPSPGRGFMQIDGPADEDPGIAVAHALVEVRRGTGLEEM